MKEYDPFDDDDHYDPALDPTGALDVWAMAGCLHMTASHILARAIKLVRSVTVLLERGPLS